ncbi:MAG: threonine synthase [Oscillospiraceae bacterium]|jgi:threonine synthase|nr:threonine synthase [Oscillospiraceae bacterium]
MKYISTRDSALHISAAEAISRGLSHDGGLFVPESLPELKLDAVEKLIPLAYAERAAYIMKMFLEDFTESELRDFTTKAYSAEKFDHPQVAPVHSIDGTTHFLELWHGPTSAFKDMALQMLPHFLTASLTKTGETRRACILVATSGDTGKAALEGFRDVPNTRIMVFYPRDGVSEVQKKQMTTQEGANVGVTSVEGNFDDAQSGVKAIFSDEQLRDELSGKGWFLSSANSINWGRLLPQIVYYYSAYCDLVKSGAIKLGDAINFCVPTGNFGNILAGYYAKKMGLPIAKLLCASNRNFVLDTFIKSGTYDLRTRKFHTTTSPSMDILVSSNLERLIFDLSGNDSKYTASKLKNKKYYKVNDKIRAKLHETFVGGHCDDARTKDTIADVFAKHKYLIDTHTAVALAVLNDYRKDTGDNTQTVVVSTASPFKFCDAVLDALGKLGSETGLDLVDKLAEVTGNPIPAPLASLRGKPERFTDCVAKTELLGAVRDFLK